MSFTFMIVVVVALSTISHAEGNVNGDKLPHENKLLSTIVDEKIPSTPSSTHTKLKDKTESDGKPATSDHKSLDDKKPETDDEAVIKKGDDVALTTSSTPLGGEETTTSTVTTKLPKEGEESGVEETATSTSTSPGKSVGDVFGEGKKALGSEKDVPESSSSSTSSTSTVGTESNTTGLEESKESNKKETEGSEEEKKPSIGEESGVDQGQESADVTSTSSTTTERKKQKKEHKKNNNPLMGELDKLSDVVSGELDKSKNKAKKVTVGDLLKGLNKRDKHTVDKTFKDIEKTVGKELDHAIDVNKLPIDPKTGNVDLTDKHVQSVIGKLEKLANEADTKDREANNAVASQKAGYEDWKVLPADEAIGGSKKGNEQSSNAIEKDEQRGMRGYAFVFILMLICSLSVALRLGWGRSGGSSSSRQVLSTEDRGEQPLIPVYSNTNGDVGLVSPLETGYEQHNGHNEHRAYHAEYNLNP